MLTLNFTNGYYNGLTGKTVKNGQKIDSSKLNCNYNRQSCIFVKTRVFIKMEF